MAPADPRRSCGACCCDDADDSAGYDSPAPGSIRCRPTTSAPENITADKLFVTIAATGAPVRSAGRNSRPSHERDSHRREVIRADEVHLVPCEERLARVHHPQLEAVVSLRIVSGNADAEVTRSTAGSVRRPRGRGLEATPARSPACSGLRRSSPSRRARAPRRSRDRPLAPGQVPEKQQQRSREGRARRRPAHPSTLRSVQRR